ncbi:MAG: DUF1800 domain-containing protein [Acidobacteria bacterium]|nr:DUF1800 domain-containing protein [Acidobacteriota bacterium]
MARGERIIEHLLRRAGFGAGEHELEFFSSMPYGAAVDWLVDYERIEDRVDDFIGQPGFVSVVARRALEPRTVINDARQRWLFRMIHTERPLQEKMALFWHNHFATGYARLAGLLGGAEATRYLNAKPSEDPGQVLGQLELFRKYATGNFRDLLLEISKDIAMNWWLDGRLNTRVRPQENFGREILELFSLGVGHHTESDVYAAARVFTGWQSRFVGARGTLEAHYEFVYNSGNHETAAKEFSFPIYPDGGRVIPARAAASGIEDGIDLVNALARHPQTARRLMRKLHGYFVSEIHEPEPDFIERLATIYLENNFEMKPVLRELFNSGEFQDPSRHFARYSWPVEFVVRAIKEVGWDGFSVADALTPLVNMNQQLFEPPDVAGWDLGRNWFSSGTMLARMNFAATLTRNQRFNLANVVYGSHTGTPQAMVFHMLDRLPAARFDEPALRELLDYTVRGQNWNGSQAQVLVKAAGLAHLILGSGEYQFV